MLLGCSCAYAVTCFHVRMYVLVVLGLYTTTPRLSDCSALGLAYETAGCSYEGHEPMTIPHSFLITYEVGTYVSEGYYTRYLPLAWLPTLSYLSWDELKAKAAYRWLVFVSTIWIYDYQVSSRTLCLLEETCSCCSLRESPGHEDVTYMMSTPFVVSFGYRRRLVSTSPSEPSKTHIIALVGSCKENIDCTAWGEAESKIKKIVSNDCPSDHCPILRISNDTSSEF